MTDSTTHIKLAIDGPIARIQLNNPARHNALATDDIDRFIATLDTVGQHPALRVLLITGAGEKTFCAGASLDQLSSGDLDGNHFEALTDKLAAMSLPTIAALNGSAYGGGGEIGLCCDFRLGVNGMKLMIPAARFGLCYPPSGILRYVQRLGPATAKRLLMASEELDDRTLLALGYLTHLVAPGQLESRSLELAHAICQLGPLAVRTMKQLCDQAASEQWNSRDAYALSHSCNQSEDLREGLRARAEKRPPVFSGR